jgi:hypothetical protein
MAARFGHQASIDVLAAELQMPGAALAANNEGKTPLMLACSLPTGGEAVVQFLLGIGADPAAVDAVSQYTCGHDQCAVKRVCAGNIARYDSVHVVNNPVMDTSARQLSLPIIPVSFPAGWQQCTASRSTCRECTTGQGASGKRQGRTTGPGSSQQLRPHTPACCSLLWEERCGTAVAAAEAGRCGYCRQGQCPVASL